MVVFKAYARMLPRIEAEEALSAATTIAVGTGSMKKEDLSRTIKGWQRQASAPGSMAPRKPRFNLRGLAAAGIGVQKVPAK